VGRVSVCRAGLDRLSQGADSGDSLQGKSRDARHALRRPSSGRATLFSAIKIPLRVAGGCRMRSETLSRCTLFYPPRSPIFDGLIGRD
jgi:hypothetical protein